jgi:hypothetical protein
MTSVSPLPQLSINGTSARELLDLRKAALRALDDAGKALSAMSPNGRDYIGDPAAYEAARTQHEGWQEAIFHVWSELNEQTMALYDLASDRGVLS